MNEKIKPGLLALTVAIPLCIGGISALLTGDTMKDYAALQKPPLSPPSWVFPIVWTLLYMMMGIASYLVMRSGADLKLINRALLFYAIQLALNFFWSILFFKHGLYLWAFFEIVAMWAVIIVTAVDFFRTSKTAGLLMVPYVLWTTFAAYLNFATYRLNANLLPPAV